MGKNCWNFLAWFTRWRWMSLFVSAMSPFKLLNLMLAVKRRNNFCTFCSALFSWTEAELWPKLKPGKNRLLCLYFNKILQISLILTNLFFFKPNWVLRIKAQYQSSSCFLNTWALKWSLASLSLASLPPFHARKMVLQRPLKWFFPRESAALHSSEIVCREQTHRERLFLTQTASVAPPAPVLDKYNTEG